MNKIYFLYGNDVHEINERILSIVKLIRESVSQLSINKIDLAEKNDLEDFLNGGVGVNLFINSSLTQIIINIKFIDYDQNEINKLIEHIKSLAVWQTIILVLKLDRFDKNLKNKFLSSYFYENLRSLAIVEEFNKLMSWNYKEMKERIRRIAKDFDLVFDDSTAEYLLGVFRDDLSVLRQEILKLKTYVLPSNILNESVVKSLYLNSFEVDDLYNLLLAGEDISFDLLNRVLSLKSPLYIIALLQNRFRQALQIKTLLEDKKSIFQLSKIIGISTYRLEKEISKLKHSSSETLKKIIVSLSDIEYKLKTGLLDSEKVIDMLALSCI